MEIAVNSQGKAIPGVSEAVKLCISVFSSKRQASNLIEQIPHCSDTFNLSHRVMSILPLCIQFLNAYVACRHASNISVQRAARYTIWYNVYLMHFKYRLTRKQFAFQRVQSRATFSNSAKQGARRAEPSRQSH